MSFTFFFNAFLYVRGMDNGNDYDLWRKILKTISTQVLGSFEFHVLGRVKH